MPRVLITRAPHQASALADALRALGCEPILIPTIELAPPRSFAILDEALANLIHFHWLIFTSANAVEAFARRATAQGFPFSVTAAQTPRPRIAAIGSATARALDAVGLYADLIPPQAVAESLTSAVLPHALQPDGTPSRLLLVRAEAARDHLPDSLRAAGADLIVAPVYRTIIPQASIAALQQVFRESKQHPDAITFTSSSTVINLLALLKAADIELSPQIIRASIGPVTSHTLQDAGLPPHVESPEATVLSLAHTVLQACRREG